MTLEVTHRPQTTRAAATLVPVAAAAPADAFFVWLLDDYCVEAKDIGNGLYAAIKPLIYHWTMLIGEIGDRYGYVTRFCYIDRPAAEKALREWDGTGEPIGWHRHPDTGRRRPDGDPAKEYIDR